MKQILFLIPYPLKEAPSQRFRFEQYLEKLKQSNNTIDVQSFLNSTDWRIFYSKGSFVRKGFVLLKGYIKRFLILFRIPRYDFIFIHREAAPSGPPVFEWIISKLFKKKIIYDFDDSIWLTDQRNESRLVRFFKWRSKVKSICRWSYKVSCGNAYLCRYAAEVNDHTILNPTTIDTEHVHNSSFRIEKNNSTDVIIGWTGTHSTLKYLVAIQNVLQRILNENKNVTIAVIADSRPDLSIPYTFIPWRKESEISDLGNFDIGLMPLPDDDWSKGKCGFKALQYMALEIPAVASPVGVNTSIIEHTISGFLCKNEDDWYEFLSRLIADPVIRNQVGRAGLTIVEKRYSVLSNTPTFLSLFE